MHTNTSTNQQDRVSRISSLGLLLAVLISGVNTLSAQAQVPSGSTPISNVTFVVFDTETTGFNPAKDKLVEIAAVRFRNREVLGEQTWLIDPERWIPYWAEKVHGINAEMVTNSPTFAECFSEFEEFIGDSVLMAHNAPFDVRFVALEVNQADLAMPKNPVIDTLPLFRHWLPDCKAHTLSELAEKTQIDAGSFHRALDDSLYVFLIFDKIVDEHGGYGQTLDELYEQAGGKLNF